MCILGYQHRPLVDMTGLTFRTARELVQDPHACFRVVAAKKHIALLPKYIGDLSRGIREQLDAEINLYSARLSGVMVAYSNVRRFQEHGTVLGSQPYLHLYIQADFIVFQPTAGSILKGVVNKVGRDFVGCLVHGCFNASIPKRSRDGVLLIADGIEIEVGQTFLFQVVKCSANNCIFSIRGAFYEDSFLDFPTPPPASEKHAWDETDGIEAEVEELPTIIHKRRRTMSGSVAVMMELDEAASAQESVGLAESIDSTTEQSAKKKKKKKKKKRDDDDGGDIVDAPISNTGLEVDQSEEAELLGHMGYVPESLTEHSTSEQNPKKEKKKKKKHRAADDAESVVNTATENHMGETDQSLESMLGHVDGVGQSGECSTVDITEKETKKRKKHKRKHGEVGLINDNSAALACEETVSPVPEAQPIYNRVPKKKKKKHKHKGE